MSFLQSLSQSLAKRSKLSKPCLACIITAARSLSTTSTLYAAESKRKRTARRVKKAHLDRKAAVQTELARTLPNLVTGIAKHDKRQWAASKLNRLLLDADQIWSGPSLVDSRPPNESGDLKSFPVEDRYNFGYTAKDIKPFVEQLQFATVAMRYDPKAAEHASKSDAHRNKLEAEIIADEDDKQDHFLRIVDLKNANSRGIRVENIRRIIWAFSPAGKLDTGSPEAQAAVLTVRIIAIAKHMSTAAKDVYSQRGLVRLINDRRKILAYLKHKDIARYHKALDDIGISRRAVEGEIVLTRERIRQDCKDLPIIGMPAPHVEAITDQPVLKSLPMS